MTTCAELERTALDLFRAGGFEATSVGDIATAAGISRRTFFRYFATKADTVWGSFDQLVEQLRQDLASAPPEVGLAEAVRSAVLAFNAVPPGEEGRHRERLSLILGEPVVAASSTLRFNQWRIAVEEFAATRIGGDLLRVRIVGHDVLGAALAAYEQWLTDTESELSAVLERSLTLVAPTLEAASAP